MSELYDKLRKIGYKCVHDNRYRYKELVLLVAYYMLLLVSYFK